jgi:hypothetical protein
MVPLQMGHFLREGAQSLHTTKWPQGMNTMDTSLSIHTLHILSSCSFLNCSSIGRSKKKKNIFWFFFFLWYWVLSSGPPSCRQTIYHLCYAPSLMFAFTGFLAYVKFSIVKCFIMTFPKTHGVYLGHIHLLYCSFWTLSEGVLLCSPGCPQTYNPPAFTSHVLGLQARTTVPRKEKNF